MRIRASLPRPPLTCPSSPLSRTPAPSLGPRPRTSREMVQGMKHETWSPLSSRWIVLDHGRPSVSRLPHRTGLRSGSLDPYILTYPSPRRTPGREERCGIEPRLPVQHRGAHLHRQPRCARAPAGGRAARVVSRPAGGGLPERGRPRRPRLSRRHRSAVHLGRQPKPDLPGALRVWAATSEDAAFHQPEGWCH